MCVCDRGDYPAPLGMWMTSHGQCPRGGGACECPRVGVFFNFSLRADDVTRTMSKGGGGACECECPRVGVFFKFSEGG